MDCIGWRLTPRTSRTRIARAWRSESGLAARSSQLGRAPFSSRPHFATPHSHAPRHVEVTERSSCWHPVLSGTVVFLDSVGTNSLQVLLQRRLSLPLPLSKRSCRCGLLLDTFGHHRGACSRSGALGRRGFSLESAAARVCREAGGRVVANFLVRDMDLGLPIADESRRLEVVVDGLLLFGGAQFAVDTTLVSVVQGDGQPQRGAPEKETTYPELVRPGSRARLVVLALEVGGRWFQEARTFVQLLAQARARSEPPLTRRRLEQAWRLRWFLSCAAARVFAASLLELRGGHGADGQVPPAHEVEREQLHAGLCG